MKSQSYARSVTTTVIDRLAAKHASLRYRHQLRQRAARISNVERQVRAAEASNARSGEPPVLVFNPTAHITQLSLNGSVSLLVPWSLRLVGQPIRYLVCAGGLGKCVLGTQPTDTLAPPPCAECRSFTSSMYPAALVHEFPTRARGAQGGLAPATSLADLTAREYRGYPLGKLCVPATRWVLRRFDFENDPAAPALLASFVAGASRIVDELEATIERYGARALLVFNGVFYPEATARAVALKHGVATITYESAYLPLSIFMSHGIAPEHAFEIPASFVMGPTENAVLDAYLDQRFRGEFTKAGVKYWPKMEGIPQQLDAKIKSHRQVVTAFTNVVSDTGQGWAHTIFTDMFEWLSEILAAAARRPDTLFVIRVHPDELRPGRESRQTVETWLAGHPLRHLANVHLIRSTEYINSYELMRSSKFCLVYSSTVGIEATLLGTPVVSGGRSRYWREGFTHVPPTRDVFRQTVGGFLDGAIPPVPEEWTAKARRYLYYAFFRTSISLADFIAPITQYDHTLHPFDAPALHPARSREMGIIHAGIFDEAEFHYG